MANGSVLLVLIEEDTSQLAVASGSFQGVGAGEALTPLGLTPKMPSLSPVVRDSLLLVNCKS